MGSRGTEIDGQPTADSTPEDVAVLYSWAHLQGAKYRDYSASRRQYRAQVRYRAAKALLERELKARMDAEVAAAETERIAVEATVRWPNEYDDSPATYGLSQQKADEAAWKAAADRVEAARRAEAVAHAAVVALREEREVAEAHSSARRKAQLYEESEQRRRQLAGPQPRIPRSWLFAAPNESRNDSSGDRQQLPESDVQDSPAPLPELFTPESAFKGTPFDPAFESDLLGPMVPVPASPNLPLSSGPEHANESDPGPTGPAWLFASQTPPQARALPPASLPAPADLVAGDTLQESRERVAARWFALKEVFEQRGQDLPAIQATQPVDERIRLLAVFSLAGGVGKTSLVATLGRALASQGERVVLTDTTPQGLLPIYFGVREVRPGIVATFLPPPQSTGQPISMVNYDLTGKGEFKRERELLAEEILRNVEDNQRLLLDISSASSWLVRHIADLHPIVLVPVTPDMNSVLSLLAVETLFRSITDSAGRSLPPFYVLNQFDAALPLHLDVREVLRRQLGDRLRVLSFGAHRPSARRWPRA
jgi:cellulose biosynthesis protein BcsQ